MEEAFLCLKMFGLEIKGRTDITISELYTILLLPQMFTGWNLLIYCSILLKQTQLKQAYIIASSLYLALYKSSNACHKYWEGWASFTKCFPRTN